MKIAAQHDNFTNRDPTNVVPRHPHRNEYATHKAQLIAAVGQGTKPTGGDIEAMTVLAYPQEGTMHTCECRLFKSMCASHGNELCHLIDLPRHSFHSLAEGFILRIQPTARLRDDESANGHKNQEEWKELRSLHRCNTHCPNKSEDCGEPSVGTGLHHGLNIFDIPDDLGLEDTSVGARVVADGKILNAVAHGVAEKILKVTHHNAPLACIESIHWNVLNDEHQQHNRIDDKVMQWSVLHHNIDTVRDDCRQHKHGTVLEPVCKERKRCPTTVTMHEPHKSTKWMLTLKETFDVPCANRNLHCSTPACCRIGSEMVVRKPPKSLGDKAIWPPCCPTIAAMMLMPKPEPPVSRAREGSKR